MFLALKRFLEVTLGLVHRAHCVCLSVAAVAWTLECPHFATAQFFKFKCLLTFGHFNPDFSLSFSSVLCLPLVK